MGVQGLWQLLDPLGRPVSLETLENKILAIDASIWLHQAVHGFRDKSNNPLPNAHLLGLFHRVCKLLFYGIKPVFVFDGAVPFLKRQTMAKRRDRQQNASRDAEKTYHQIVHKYIQSKAIKDVLGEQSSKSDAGSSSLPELISKRQTTDMYDLPPLPSTSLPKVNAPHLKEISTDDEDDEFYIDPMSSRISAYHDVDTIDFESEDFTTLPLEIQHELLLEMKERNKRRYWIEHEPLPEKAEDIGSFQIKQLLYRRKLQRKIESINKDMRASLSGQLASEHGMGTNGNEHVLEAKRVSSEDSTHYILFKNLCKDTSKPKTVAPVASISAGNENKLFKTSSENPVTASRNMWLKSIAAAPISPIKLHKTYNVKTSGDETETSDISTLIDQTSHLTEVNIVNQNLTIKGIWKSNSISIHDVEDASNKSASIYSAGNFPKKESNGAESVSLVHDNNDAITNTASDLLKNAARAPCIEMNLEKPIYGNDELKIKGSLDKTALNPSEKHKFEDIPVIPVMSSSEDEDDDFIEVSINLEKIKEEDELFPLEIFHNPINTVDSKKVLTEPEYECIENPESVARLPTVPEFEMASPKDRTDLFVLSEELERQTESLVQDKGRQERIAATITEQMYNESQELLKLFGIPFVISPAEAEAQCAAMDLLDLTDGTITDDSDVWLFGARRVYKNFFENKLNVLFFSQADVVKRLCLDRSKLIAVALLTGSDYTEGIKGVGIVTAMEILAEFKEVDGFESLKKLGAWWRDAQEQKVAPSETKVKQKLRKLALSEGFPSTDVLRAYLEPLVDSSKESFSWARPDLDALRNFASGKLNWPQKKTDDMLLPIIKKLNTAKDRQIRIDSFFPAAVRREQSVKHQSRRLKRALNKVGSVAEISEAVGSRQPRTKTHSKLGGCTSKTRKRNLPAIAKHSDHLRLSESSNSSSEEEWTGLQKKPK